MFEQHLLSLLIFLPVIGAMIVATAPTRKRDAADSGLSPAAILALVVAGAEFVLAICLWFRFEPGRPGFQFRELGEWIPGFGINYDVGLDGMSLLLVMLTAFLTLLSVLYSVRLQSRIREYMVCLLVLEAAMMGVFVALDLALFYVFWEIVLIPMYFLIGIWGHERRIYAAIKFFVYTFTGSVLMLVGIIYLYVQTGSFSLLELGASGSPAAMKLAGIPAPALMYLYGAFALAFMIKVPMIPFHTWLPDAHVEAPTAGSVILAGVLLKMGVYGFIRVCLPLFPEQMQASAPLFLWLSVIAIIYGAIVAAIQPDMKKLVAYTSVSHMGVVMLGVFSFNVTAMTGAILQSVNHGISTGMLFFLVGMLYDRKHTRAIAAYGGIRRIAPFFGAVFLIAAFSSAALPMTNGFVGEFLVLQGAYLAPNHGPMYAAIAACGMIFSAVYMLWLFQRVFCGPQMADGHDHVSDLTMRERFVLVPLVVMVLWLGCYVSPWIRPLTGIAQQRQTADQQAASAVPTPGGFDMGQVAEHETRPSIAAVGQNR